MPHVIAILEDNADRVAVMRAKLADGLSQHEHFVTDDPPTLIDFLERRWADILLVSLDHDLHERPDHSTTLTGLQAAQYLAGRDPAFPVLMHTTNRVEGRQMRVALKDAGWHVRWVHPFDDTNWIGSDWYPTLERALRKFARTD